MFFAAATQLTTAGAGWSSNIKRLLSCPCRSVSSEAATLVGSAPPRTPRHAAILCASQARAPTPRLDGLCRPPQSMTRHCAVAWAVHCSPHSAARHDEHCRSPSTSIGPSPATGQAAYRRDAPRATSRSCERGARNKRMSRIRPICHKRPRDDRHNTRRLHPALAKVLQGTD